tara:strand:- start:56 stop:880 length:825 start_codon:yes stop_codon:yes gene_type:complete
MTENVSEEVKARRKYQNEWRKKKRREDKKWAEKEKENRNKDYQKHQKKRVAHQASYRQDNLEKVRKSSKQTWKKYSIRYNKQRVKFVLELKKEVLSHYSKNMSCANCNESELEFLAIDHIHGRNSVGHSRNFGSTTIYRWLKKQAFPSGYQVLCHNCNLIKEIVRRRNRKLLSNSPRAVSDRRRRKKIKFEVFSHYSDGKPKCNCCGFSDIDALSIDHIRGRKRESHDMNFTGRELYSLLKRTNFPKHYQVLCLNCNLAKDKRNNKTGKCPHKQ